MCLAIPGKIQSIEMMHDGALLMAKASFGGIIKEEFGNGSGSSGK